jgi:hypothetical protein
MKAYGSGCIDPHFPDLGTSWRWVVNFTPRPFKQICHNVMCINNIGIIRHNFKPIHIRGDWQEVPQNVPWLFLSKTLLAYHPQAYEHLIWRHTFITSPVRTMSLQLDSVQHRWRAWFKWEWSSHPHEFPIKLRDEEQRDQFQNSVVKVKRYPCNRPWRLYGCETSRLPRLLDNRLTDGGEVASLTRQPPYTSKKISGTHFC